MKITVLGSGVIVPQKERGFSGYLIEIDGEKLLFDCGAGTVSKLTKLGFDVSQLNYLFITHFHIDHVSDYPTLVKSRAFTGRKTLNVYGPEGLINGSKMLFEEFPWFSYMGKQQKCFEYLKLKEVTEGLVEQTDKWKVNCIPVVHYKGIAYRIDSNNKSLLYSGDTAYDENLIKLGKGVDVAILECSYPDEKTLIGIHLIPSQVGEIANKIKCKKVVLTHLYPQCRGREREMVEKVKEKFDGEVIIAEDEMKIEI